MTKFNIKLMGPCRVLEATHESFTILDANDQHVASGVNVETDKGQRFIRIFDYDVPIKADLNTYFSSRKGVDEVSFSRPYLG